MDLRTPMSCELAYLVERSILVALGHAEQYAQPGDSPPGAIGRDLEASPSMRKRSMRLLAVAGCG